MQSSPYTVPLRPPPKQEDCFTMPGFGLPLDYCPLAMDAYGIKHRALFPSALDDRDIEKGYISQPLMTLREKTMIRLLNEFTDLQDWPSKAFDATYMENWRRQVMSTGEDISEKMVDWICDELKFKARLYQRTGTVSVFNGDVIKADKRAFVSIVENIRRATENLEKIAASIELYHKVAVEDRERSFMHPSLFPLVFGRSRILRDRVIGVDEAIDSIGQGEVLRHPENPGISRKDMSWAIASRADVDVRPFNSRFQWLPTDVGFRADGSCYRMIEQTLDEVIPIWNLVLTPLVDLLHSRSRIELHNVQYHKVPDPNDKPPAQKPGETDPCYEERIRDWKRERYVVVQPEPGKFSPIAMPPELLDDLPPEKRSTHRIESRLDLLKDFGRSRGLQVFIRTIDFGATPEKPVFDTTWHIDGQMNEHVCATALIWYIIENAEVVQVEFRQSSDVQPLLDVEHDQAESVWLEQIFGLTNNHPAVQGVGAVRGRTGRVIAWPNLLQHKVHVEAKDRSKPARVRGVKIMLVDPNIRIISTANVPPQRADWVDSHHDKSPDQWMSRMKREQEIKRSRQEFPLGFDEAWEIFTEFRKELVAFNHYQDVAFHSKVVQV